MFYWFIKRFIFPYHQSLGCFHLFQYSVTFHKETSCLICFANQVISFYMECNTWQKWVKGNFGSLSRGQLYTQMFLITLLYYSQSECHWEPYNNIPGLIQMLSGFHFWLQKRCKNQFFTVYFVLMLHEVFFIIYIFHIYVTCLLYIYYIIFIINAYHMFLFLLDIFIMYCFYYYISFMCLVSIYIWCSHDTYEFS